MITRAVIAGIFGTGASQNVTYLKFQISPNWSAEAILVNLLNNLLKPGDVLLQAEDGSYLTSEQGDPLSGGLVIRTIEAELWKIILLSDSRISRVFIGINEAI